MVFGEPEHTVSAEEPSYWPKKTKCKAIEENRVESVVL